MAIKKKNEDMETLDENGNIKEKIYTYPNGATLIFFNQTVDKTTDAQIAFNCGFGSSSYFAKVFRNAYGRTPC